MNYPMESKVVRRKNNSCSHVRNICVLAHVDHGKTTLVDCLLASNGIISQRMAGKLRYMDSRPDEQQRGITMKSSSISLIFKYATEKNYLINVIDSPGHVDFFGEVSTALRICDGCIIVVDVIEGVCSQTRAALQQAWSARVRPILVLNKIDRLFVEKKLSTLDIYIHLSQTLEQVNAFVGELFASDVLSKASSNVNDPQEETKSVNLEKTKKQIFYDWSSGLEDVDDSGVYFSPENGNVIFASAIDGWGFTITDFARVLSTKLGFNENVLKKTLWGDFYINPKEKRILKGAQSKAKKPLFVTLVLENLSKIYEKFILRQNKEEIIKMADSLGIKILTRDLDRSDYRMALIQLFNQWIPLSDSLLKTVCDIVPAPCDISEERVERLMSGNQTRRFDSLPYETQMLKKVFLACKSSDSSSTDNIPVIVYVSKMFSFPRESLPQFRVKPLTLEEIAELREKLKMKNKQIDQSKNDDEDKNINQSKNNEDNKQPLSDVDKVTFIGFARVFSGTLRRNDFIYVIGPKHDPSDVTPELIREIDSSNLTLADLHSDQHVTKVQIKDLYLLMGRDLEYVEEVYAGHICGIGNLEAHVIKSATLSSTLYCPPFIDNISNSIPILRVAVETKNPSDMPALINGLRKLNQADPCVDVKIQETGEHVIITTGEVHLERCIVDLMNFLGEEIEFNISDPIVPFRETIIIPPKVDTLNENISDQKIVISSINKRSTEVIEQRTPNKRFLFRIRAKPLPDSVVEILDANKEILLQLMQFQRKNVLQDTNTNYVTDSNEIYTIDLRNAMHDLRYKLEKHFNEADWPNDTIDRIWSFGPKFCGTNLMINQLKDFSHQVCFLPKENHHRVTRSKILENDIRYVYENSFINGFQLCTQSGPLCDEPMMGVCFIVEEWKYMDDELSIEGSGSDPFGPISGQIMSTVKESCRRAFQAQPQRLMAAMFSCIIQINSDALGKMYAVLGRRHGRILHADLQEGSQIFTVSAVLPVIESFNFANEIRKQTSGKAIPQLAFSHWEIIDIDPFWTPTTEEEYKLYGEKADTENRALLYMNAVRKRKGLHVEEKIVEHAEKQRTLTKNK